MPPKPSRRGGMLHEQFKEAGLPVFGSSVQYRICHVDANESGLTLGQMKGRAATAGAKEYTRLADEILKAVGEGNESR